MSLFRFPDTDGADWKLEPRSFNRPHFFQMGNLNRIHVRLLHLLFGYDDTNCPILHGRSRLIHLHVLWLWESVKELTVASLKSMPTMDQFLLLPFLLIADLEDAAFHDLDLNILLFDAREFNLEDVSLRRLLPLEARVGEGRNLSHEIGARSVDSVVGEGGEAL
ncbi:hypothetical protein IEQ34_005735 [Dendrobium chrysotoxum]|uniref:Uncharacterized protein n=1 Tax=Dendrobium chrysotoxum TaxID=161865 RepID=A0AAV7HCN0_DENCH|nr:hypothetical protein IEQ34_005735 [Dendrobium chrysotoxum]